MRGMKPNRLGTRGSKAPSGTSVSKSTRRDDTTERARNAVALVASHDQQDVGRALRGHYGRRRSIGSRRLDCATHSFTRLRSAPPRGAALITGRNHHSVGFGVITEMSTGYPGYDSVIGKDSASIGRILKDNGYATSWIGKNHNTPSYQLSLAGPFDQWPSGMGFDHFYGFMGGETDQWTPFLFRDHTQVFPWVDRPGYNLTTDMAAEAISYMKRLNDAAPDKPFFVY